jgi:predicted CoA-binding protein
MNVAVIGASHKPERFSYKAIAKLLAFKHTVFPVHPALKEVLGLPVFASPSALSQPIHTVTLYVNADVSSKMSEEILALRPKRVIFNPGAENPEFTDICLAKGIEAVEACTLVMLDSNLF